MAKIEFEKVFEKILMDLEKGTPPWVNPVTKGGFPKNLKSKNYYSGINILLLWSAQIEKGFTSNLWATFNQVKEMGGKIRKGESATPILLFVNKDKKEGEAEEENKGYRFARTIPVFNLAQTTDLNLLENEPGAREEVPTFAEEKATKLIEKNYQYVEFNNLKMPCFVPAQDKIFLPEKSAFNSDFDFFATAFHEFSHWTGAEKRLNRDLKNRFGSEAYAMEELIAEISAAFLCSEMGFGYKTQHASYISSWHKILKNDPKSLLTASSKAMESANYLLN